MKKITLLLIWLAVFSLGVSASFSPDSTGGAWGSYVYDSYKTPVRVPDGYQLLFESGGKGATPLSEPEDFFVSGDGEVYVADTKNNRIVIYDRDMNFLSEITVLSNDGMLQPIRNPRGIFVSPDGLIYLSDADKRQIEAMNRNGEIQKVWKEPQSELIPEGLVYNPTKLVADSAGRVYVLAEGNFNGLLRFHPDGGFDSYFASNRIDVTPQIILERFWRGILSREQTDSMVKFNPIEYSGVDIDGSDFIFTSVRTSSNSTDELKRLNPTGINVLPSNDFGDLDYVANKGVRIDTSFVDVDVDELGFVTGFDITRGRIFQYNRESTLLFAFGTIGEQSGTFKKPTAIESWGERIYCLDSDRGTVTVFETTDYGKALRKAMALDYEGLYEEAESCWNQVLTFNGNCEQAYAGMGKALLKRGRYKEAEMYFKAANSRTDYQKAFVEVRRETVEKAVPYAGGAVILLLLAVKLVPLFRKLKGRKTA